MGWKLYVGGLAHTMTAQDLNTMFAPYGTVNSARIAVDKQTGESRGFGFVEMGNETGAESAITALHANEVGGRPITVKVSRTQLEKNGGSSHAEGGAGKESA